MTEAATTEMVRKSLWTTCSEVAKISWGFSMPDTLVYQ